jgi:hypothetical protein
MKKAEKSKPSPEEMRIEGNKLLHETLKQLVTISSASIVILSALLEKLVASQSKILMGFIGLSFICFLVSIIGSVFLMRNIGLNLAATDSELKGAAYFAAKWFFLSAIFLLVVYVIANLLYR